MSLWDIEYGYTAEQLNAAAAEEGALPWGPRGMASPDTEDGDHVRKIRPPMSVTVAPEWGYYPLWIEYSPDEPRDNAPAESLSDYGAEPSLISSINSWDDSYQAVYDPTDPASSGSRTRVKQIPGLRRVSS